MKSLIAANPKREKAKLLKDSSDCLAVEVPIVEREFSTAKRACWLYNEANRL